MDEILGQRPSICPPVLISSIPDDTPRPSSAVGDQEDEEDEDQVEAGPSRPKRKRKDGLMDLIREDMKQQREAEERRTQESRENLNRLFSLLEKLVVLLDLAATIKTLVSSDARQLFYIPLHIIVVTRNLLQGRHLCRQLVPPRSTTDCLQHILPLILRYILHNVLFWGHDVAGPNADVVEDGTCSVSPVLTQDVQQHLQGLPAQPEIRACVLVIKKPVQDRDA
ncbi:hypothetical protein F7725_021390 [Dissostichus mawsoni]|uniref:Uncharacterized protein n=1 Tax=Dissostichus mawsoni TaxID=36200 RepID=A0A7J5ZCX8_DISMA|nr:hypothetical protein F7725_021390 [Dissostichus mawsoni]